MITSFLPQTIYLEMEDSGMKVHDEYVFYNCLHFHCYNYNHTLTDTIVLNLAMSVKLEMTKFTSTL